MNKQSARRRVRALTRELAKEVGPGHVLAGRRWRVVAGCPACDDVVVVLDDGRTAFVHLTWAGRRERPPWPATVVSTAPVDRVDVLSDRGFTVS